MKDSTFEKTIPVSQLLLDTQNPRLPEVQDNQHGAIRTMVQTQADKIIALAEHIVNNGLNPASLLIVSPSSNDEGMYEVLDGNRRVTALKVLATPTIADGILNSSNLQKLKRMSTEFEKNPITELLCVVTASRDEADIWIQLIHRGQQQGAGLVEWDGQVAARYDARRNNRPHVALEVLDYVKAHATLPEKTRKRIEQGKFPITNLQRLLNTPYVRKKLGIGTSSSGEILIFYPEEEILKGLARVIDDLGSGRVTVSKIKSQEQRIDYINSLSKEQLPESEKALSQARRLGKPPSSLVKTGSNSTSSKRTRGYRTTLIPRYCKLKIEKPRINKIYTELKHLSVDDFPNAGAIMLRVFIELSLDHFLEHSVGWPEPQINGSTLAQKLTSVANFLEKSGMMTTNQLAPVKKAASGQTLLSASIKTMHGYVHNRHFSPIASEIKTAWDDFQPFIENLWPL